MPKIVTNGSVPDVNFSGVSSIAGQPEVETRTQRIADTLTYSLPSVALGFSETLGTSVGLIDDNDITDFLSQYNTTQGLGDFYQRNKPAAQIVGDFTGMLIPGMVAVKAANSVSKISSLARATGRLKYMGSLVNSGKKADAAQRAVRMEIARDAARGSTNFLSNQKLQRLQKATKNFRTTSAIKDAVAFEVGVAATMNTSDVLFPDDYSTLDQIALNSVLPAGAVFLERALLNRQFRNQILDASKKAIGVRGQRSDRIVRESTADVALVSDSLQAQVARELKASTDDATVRSRANTDLQVFESAMKDDAEFLGRMSPYKGVTEKTKLTPQQTKTVLESERKDTGTNIGAVSFEELPSDFNGVIDKVTTKETRAQELIKKGQEALKKPKITPEQRKKAQETLEEGREIERLSLYTLDVDGTIVPSLERTPLFSDRPGWEKQIKAGKQNAASDNSLTRVIEDFNGAPIGQFTERGLLEIAGGRKFEDLGLVNRSALYRLGQRTVDKFSSDRITDKITFSNQDPHFKLDYIEALWQQHGDEVLDNIIFPSNINSIDDLRFESLDKKYKEYLTLKKPKGELRIDGKIFMPAQEVELTSYNLSRRLNLPQDSKILEAFESFRIQGDSNLYDAIASMDGVPAPNNMKKYLQEIEEFPIKGSFEPDRNIPLIGDMFRLPTDTAPVLTYKKPVASTNLTKYVKQGYAAAKAEVFSTLGRANQSGATVVGAVFDEFTKGSSQGLYKAIMDIENLAEGSRRGSGSILTRQFSAGDNPTLRAAMSAAEITDRVARREVGKLYEQHIPEIRAIRSSTADTESFNLYTNMRRSGWDLKRDPRVVDDKFEFVLDDTAFNRTKFKQRFGTELAENTAAPTIGKDYVPLRVNNAVLGAASAIDDIDGHYLRNTNVIRRAKGQSNMKRKPWHVPPKDFSRRPTVVVLSPAGQVDSVVDGRTIQDATNKAEQIVSAKDASGFYVADMKDLGNYADIRDQAFERMMDFSDVLQQTSRSKGTSVSDDILESGTGVMDDILASQQKHFESVIRRTRGTMFEGELIGSRQLMQRSEQTRSIQQGSSTYQMYTSALMGNPMLSKRDNIGQAYFGVETIYDETLNKLFDRVTGKGRVSGKQAENVFTALDKELGQYNPFSNAVDVLERTHKVSAPPTMKRHMATMNSITSALALRVLDVGHAVLTLTSLGATIPGVTKSLLRQTGEPLDRWKSRIGAFGSAVDDQGAAIFSPMRSLTSGVHFAFSPEGQRIWKEASDKGFFDQAVAEGWATLVAPKQGYVENLITKATDTLSVLSDKSEVLARGMSFMSGANIARRGLGIKDDNLVMAFAHNYANEVIGNYDPNNRPRMFQGAVGMPLGLFMTFMQNYLQRTFSYVENAQTRALATQLGTQAAVFGGSTVPGFDQFVQFFGSNYDGSTNLVDGLRNNFPEPVVDLMLYGSISTLTDTALFQRGDANVRAIPTLINPQDTPGFSMVRNFYGALTDSVGRLRNSGDLTSQDISEILGTYSSHRFTRGISDLMAGVSVDRRGNVVDEDTRGDPLEVAQRLSGLRSLQEAKETDAYFQTTMVDAQQRSILADLRRATKSSIRGGNLTPERMNQLVANYVRSGGNPTNFLRWLKDQHMAATVGRVDRKLKDIINNPRKMADILRLMSALETQPGDPVFGE